MRKVVYAGFIAAAALVLTVFTCLVAKADPIAAAYVGANGVWFDDSVKPSDFELGGTANSSLSPHISIVGSAWYGLDKSYLRATIGPRITVSDPDDQNMSIGVGLEYQASSKPSVRPEEWQGTVSLGVRPWAEYPNLIVGIQGSYGVDFNDAAFLAALRYRLGVH